MDQTGLVMAPRSLMMVINRSPQPDQRLCGRSGGATEDQRLVMGPWVRNQRSLSPMVQRLCRESCWATVDQRPVMGPRVRNQRSLSPIVLPDWQCPRPGKARSCGATAEDQRPVMGTRARNQRSLENRLYGDVARNQRSRRQQGRCCVKFCPAQNSHQGTSYGRPRRRFRLHGRNAPPGPTIVSPGSGTSGIVSPTFPRTP